MTNIIGGENRKTPLYKKHIDLGAKMVEFGGWEMPVQYSGIIDEHNTVRNFAGLFDVSHMGQVFVSGNDALTFLQKIVPQDISNLSVGKAVYCQLTRDNGGIVDDLIVYNLGDSLYLIIVNAANIEKDFAWFIENSKDLDVLIQNKSSDYSMLALQGQNACKILEKSGFNISDLPKFFSIIKTVLLGKSVFLSRTGYTGEDGFEIILKNDDVSEIWDLLLEYGQEFGIKPIGLGARDTLRLEAALMLYGNDLDDETTPVEAGLSWSIPKSKIDDYHGKVVIKKQLEVGVAKKLIGFVMTERAIPRHGYEIYYKNNKVGIVTSGGYSPTMDKNIGMGYVDTKMGIGVDSDIQIMVRNKLYNAKVIKRPFVQKRYKIS